MTLSSGSVCVAGGTERSVYLLVTTWMATLLRYLLLLLPTYRVGSNKRVPIAIGKQ